MMGKEFEVLSKLIGFISHRIYSIQVKNLEGNFIFFQLLRVIIRINRKPLQFPSQHVLRDLEVEGTFKWNKVLRAL